MNEWNGMGMESHGFYWIGLEWINEMECNGMECNTNKHSYEHVRIKLPELMKDVRILVH